MTDIQAGDVVVCVKDDWRRPLPCDPKKGDVLRVAAVSPHTVDGLGAFVFLGFVGKPGNHGWSINGFRKIDKATDDFTTQIKAIRPIREDA